MAQSPEQVVDQVAQLDAARKLVLGDAALYPQIVNGILPIVGANARLELRRWGAEFLAETFASPILATSQKQQLAPTVLNSIQETLLLPETDNAVLASLIQTCASMYPLIFRHTVNHPGDNKTWEMMSAVKQEILRKMDSFPCSVKICCIKFLQRVVQVQTPGLIADPRRPDQNETSLAVVPRNHALLSLPQLEAESSGLLDRLLDVLQEETCNPLIVNATLNCLAPLIRTRQSIANKIIQSIMDFFPTKHVHPPFTPTVRVGVKSMERTARALLFNVMKKNPGHPLMGKMQHYIERLMQSRLETAEDASRKRGPPAEPTDGLDQTKRARLDAVAPPPLKIPPLPAGPTSYDQLFTLTQDIGLSSFDVKQLPPDIVVKIAIPLLSQVNPALLTQAVDAIRNRYETITKEQNHKRQQLHQAATAAAADDDDDYEPDYEPEDIGDNGPGEAAAIAQEEAELEPDLVSLGPFVLPQPPPLSEEEASEVGRSAVSRVFGMIDAVDAASSSSSTQTKPQQLGFARLAGSTFDREAWVVLLTRLATRAPAGLEIDDKVKAGSAGVKRHSTISDSIRETLYRYILEDFRARLKIGITWLNEEWYNDRVRMKAANQERTDADDEPTVTLYYDTWVLRLLDGFLPYLDSKDIKILVRFLSEIPEVTIAIIQRVAGLARDPERITLTVQALMYLVMFRPPAREMCLNAMEDVYQTYEESRPAAGKVLAKWRPQALPAPAEQASTNDSSNPTQPAPSTEAQAST
ncbi:Uncharacterized protein PECH_006738 [Penicillium ucsense]|uniref:Symplekin/Pta1 N-terminal domain-containing protein n=1 Tax=Penicillium ucsense TaxID=2839758 RepID=A0A8J8WGA5_9EURO|nr:Uncharacterized protein PECM_000441 [Penicillium ucsense]KAF7735327.1 Uncharacterized protein PECH_006738 [Penicillium ucsense]